MSGYAPGGRAMRMGSLDGTAASAARNTNEFRVTRCNTGGRGDIPGAQPRHWSSANSLVAIFAEVWSCGTRCRIISARKHPGLRHGSSRAAALPRRTRQPAAAIGRTAAQSRRDTPPSAAENPSRSGTATRYEPGSRPATLPAGRRAGC